MGDIKVEQESEFVWKIPKSDSMNVPAVVYASDKIMENIKKDLTLQQIKNVACLKGIQKQAIALPDSHQ